MWHAEHTLETTATPERVWALMQKVAAWPEWDAGLAWAELTGAFAAGAQGRVKSPSDGPRAFLLAAVDAPSGFTALTRFPLAEVRHIHHQERTAIGTRLTHRVEISGPLSWYYVWSVGRKLREGLAPGLRRLARLAS
jgi:hypothetical protein